MSGRTWKWSVVAIALALGAAGCNGDISNVSGPGGGGTYGVAGGGGGAQGSAGVGGDGPEPIPPPDADVGRVAIHRLNNLEYDNTIRDLLGVTSQARATFISDEQGDFDNDAESFTVSDARYEQYYNAADAIATQVFADAALKARVVTCAPNAANPADATCAKQIIAAFGARAWRRPLTSAEVDRLAKVAADAKALGVDFAGSIQQVVTVMLASPQFLFRIEIDPDPTSAARHALTGYELATRLSYLGWSTMPDERLFTLAGNGQLLHDDVLSAEVDRLLKDPKGATFTESFAGQWLGIRELGGHQVEGTAFPEWDEPLRAAMIQEEQGYFKDFLETDRDLNQFFTTDFNLVNARLARHYGMTGVSGDAPVRVSRPDDHRVGFMGLGGFLTVSSFSYRTAPTLRGRWVLENLLCTTIEKPANPAKPIPPLDDENASDPASQQLNVAAKLAQHRTDPDCAVCHKVLDPIGLGMENFDAIGRYRTAYAGGDQVDASGVMPSGEAFTGLEQLAAIVSRDTRFLDCASKKLMIYALSRSLAPSDGPFLNQVRYRWRHQGTSVRALLKAIVLNDTFRYRRGEP